MKICKTGSSLVVTNIFVITSFRMERYLMFAIFLFLFTAFFPCIPTTPPNSSDSLVAIPVPVPCCEPKEIKRIETDYEKIWDLFYKEAGVDEGDKKFFEYVLKKCFCFDALYSSELRKKLDDEDPFINNDSRVERAMFWLDLKDSQGRSPLHVAAQHGMVRESEAFLSFNAHIPTFPLPLIEVADKNGFTPLHVAVINGHKKCVELLLEKGADTRRLTLDGKTVLHFAQESKDAGLIEMVGKASKNDEKKEAGVWPSSLATQLTPLSDWTSFHLAVWNEQPEALATLLSLDASFCNSADKEGNTPLHLAAFKGNALIIKILIEAGAFKEAKNKEGHTPLHVAVVQKKLEAAKELLLHGADQEEKDAIGNTSLLLAVVKEDSEMVRLFIENGASVRNPNRYEYTPYQTAVYRDSYGGNAKITRLLEKTERDECAGYWYKVLKCADKTTKNFAVDVTKFLLTQAEYKTVLPKGHIILHSAIEKGYKEAVELLIKGGADKEGLNEATGVTPLCLAVMRGHKEIAHYLIKAGASVDLVSRNGWTPLCFAAFKGDREMIEMLLEEGANPSFRTPRGGWLPLHCTAARGGFLAMRSLCRRAAVIEKILGPQTIESLSPQEIKRLIKKTMIPEETLTPDILGSLPLHLAVRAGNIRGVEALHALCPTPFCDQIELAESIEIENYEKEKAPDKPALERDRKEWNIFSFFEKGGTRAEYMKMTEICPLAFYEL